MIERDLTAMSWEELNLISRISIADTYIMAWNAVHILDRQAHCGEALSRRIFRVINSEPKLAACPKLVTLSRVQPRVHRRKGPKIHWGTAVT